MPPSKRRYLVETSALRPALGSPSAKHNQCFADAVRDGDLYTSVYIRMEFVRHWVCYFIRAAIYVSQCDDVVHALYLLEQEFGRGPKDALSIIQQHLRSSGALANTTSAEEIASLAVRLLERFDDVFRARIDNACKCEIGTKTPSPDYNYLLHDLHAFHEDFLTPITECQINKFLTHRGRGDSLTKNKGLANLAAVEKLTDLQKRSKWITCKECRGIGDAAIALEQPELYCLVHIDMAFNQLCPALKREHKHIESALSVDRVELKTPSKKHEEPKP